MSLLLNFLHIKSVFAAEFSAQKGGFGYAYFQPLKGAFVCLFFCTKRVCFPAYFSAQKGSVCLLIFLHFSVQKGGAFGIRTLYGMVCICNN